MSRPALHLAKLRSEPDGGIEPHRPTLAHSSIQRMGLHVGTKLKRAVSLVARVAEEPNGFWKTLAVSSVGLIILMLGAFLAYQVAKTDAIENDVDAIQTDIALIKQRLGIEDDGR